METEVTKKTMRKPSVLVRLFLLLAGIGTMADWIFFGASIWLTMLELIWLVLLVLILIRWRSASRKS